MLETLRAYGRRAAAGDDGVAGPPARRATSSGWPSRPPAACRARTSGPGSSATLPDYDNLRAAFERALADRDADLALRLVTSLPEVTQIRVGYEAADWAERALDLADRAAPAVRRRGRRRRPRRLEPSATSPGPGALAARAGRPRTRRGHRAYRLSRRRRRRRRRSTRATSTPRCATTPPRWSCARRDGDPIRLVWTLYYVAICHAVRREPELGRPAAQECLAVAEATANPTARSMARYALGLVLKKSDPARALALFDEAAELAASVPTSGGRASR